MKAEGLELSLFVEMWLSKKKKKAKEATKGTSRSNKWVYKIIDEHTKTDSLSRYLQRPYES